jgi:hypothetical protein
MTRGQRNNNPGNLRFAQQKEATGQDDKGFAIFKDAPAGFRAFHAQIKLDASRGLTLEQFIHKYAPPSENDSEQYLKVVLDDLCMTKDIPLSEVSPFAVAGVMAQMEGYYNL